MRCATCAHYGRLNTLYWVTIDDYPIVKNMERYNND